MKVYFSHGKESGPWGRKITLLAAIAREYDCQVESVDYTGIRDPDLRVEHLLNILHQEDDKFLLVGSSMGGYVTLVAAKQVRAEALFLMAPALYVDGYKKQIYASDLPRVEIIHGWSDEIIPAENSIKFAQAENCYLHLIPGDHQLNNSLDHVADIFRQFLGAVLF